MRKLLELIEKLYGKTALSKTLGTRTNVITLADNETKRFIKDELNIEAASDAAALAAKNRAEKLIADIPKMNDQEILTFTNNLQRLDNKLNPPKAEMFDITTKKPISKEGIEQLETEFGLPEGVDEGSIMGNLTRAAQRLREQAKNVPGIQEGEKLQTGVMRSAVRYKMLDDLEKGILKVSEEEAAIIKGEAKGDPLDLWLENYGPDAMEAIQEMEPALRRGTTPKDLLLTIEKNLDARPLTEAEKLEMKANTREAGRVMQDLKDRVKGVSKEELKQKDPEMYDLLYGKGDPEEFAKGGRVGYQDGGPTKDEYGIMSLPSVPSNPDSVNDDIDRVAQLVAQSSKMGPEEQMNNKQIAYDRIEEIAEQISYGGNIDGVRSNLIDYFNDKVQEYQSMIQEFSTGGRVGFNDGGYTFEQFLKDKQQVDKFMSIEELKREYKRMMELKKIRDQRDMVATGGRVGYAYGSGLKLIQVLKKAGKSLKDEIKKAVDDLIPTGDPKLDADMALDNMLEELGIDRDAIDGYDILDAYGLAYDELKRPLLKEIEETKSLAPKMTERFELKQKYPGIDDKLLTQIIDDPDPQRKAEVLATLDQAFELMRQGKSQEEVYDIMKQMTDRTKQASGGLSYLSGF